MPTVEVEIEVWCSCGEGLCRQTTTGRTNGRGQEYFTVEPCNKCLESATEDGKKDGWNEGYEAAQKEFEKSKDHP